MSDGMKCANALCRKDIPEGEQVCVWDNSSGSLVGWFVCHECSKLMEQDGLAQLLSDEPERDINHAPAGPH